jgi:8-oxo-dGTP pyrophosphatase MutT (NUDIX family)
MSSPPLIPRPAATIVLLRNSERGPEVLMVQRNHKAAFVPGAYVFPGGALDPGDHAAELQALCDGPDDAAASRALGVEKGGLAYWIAAMRELFEEAGVLLARDAGGAVLDLETPQAATRYQAHRKSVESGDGNFGAIVAAERLRLAADRLVYFGHWITPEGAARRFDARFFAAVAPERQAAAHDNREAIAHEWARPVEFLERHSRGECNLRTPTRHTLKRLTEQDSLPALMAALEAQHDTPSIMPRITQEGRFVIPGEAGYEEAAKKPGKYSEGRS